MSKLITAAGALLLAGCASMGQWQTLSIDGSTEAAFGQSLSQLNDELSYSRSQMFALALVDIARTAAQDAGQTKDGSPAYTDEDYRRDLDGLTYDGVIALADQTGPSIRNVYYAGSRVPSFANRSSSPVGPGPTGDNRLWPVNNAGLVLSDAWKEPGFSPSNFRYP